MKNKNMDEQMEYENVDNVAPKRRSNDSDNIYEMPSEQDYRKHDNLEMNTYMGLQKTGMVKLSQTRQTGNRLEFISATFTALFTFRNLKYIYFIRI